MKMRICLLVFLVFLVEMVHAQSWVLKGKVSDASDQSDLIGATIVLKSSSDSVLYGVVSDVEGMYSIEVSKTGVFKVEIRYLGYGNVDTVLNIQNQGIYFLNVSMKPDAKLLDEVEVKAEIPPVIQKGDTTQYDAKAYKTQPDASTEDLVAKMPGVVVNNGQVQVQGENVARVTVDGKTYFGDDASSVLKNLPAEVVDKIQVFDRRSDQADFTGFDDGNTTKTINIVTKQTFRNGTFGRVYAGIGMENVLYRSGSTLNQFKDNRKITLLFQSNNINEQNFAGEDLVGTTASGNRAQGAGTSGRRNMESESFQVNPARGISTTHALGLNYADKWGTKTDISASYFFNYSKTASISSIYRQFFQSQDSGLVYNENSLQQVKNGLHRFNMRITYAPDSMNSFVFEPRISFQHNKGFSDLSGLNSVFSDALSSNNIGLNSAQNAFVISVPILYRLKTKTIGRTFSIGLTLGYSYYPGDNFLNSFVFVNDNDDLSDSVRQYSSLDKNGFTLQSNVVYTEAAGKNGLLQINYTTDTRLTDSKKNTFNFSAVENDYVLQDTTLSNVFESRYLTQQAGLSYLYKKNKFQGNAGLAYQWAQLLNTQIFPSENDIKRKFQSLLPNLRLQYNFTPKKNLRFNYRTSNNAPTISQLQNVPDNSNTLQIKIGNAALKQDYRHDFRLRYASSNTEKGQSFFIMGSFTLVNNYIGNSTTIFKDDTLLSENIFVAKGGQVTQPEIFDGYLLFRIFASYSKSLTKIKSNINLNGGFTFSRTPGQIDGILNSSSNPSLNGGIVLSSNISEKLDFVVSNFNTLSFSRNTLRPQLNNTFFTQNNRARINWMFWKGFVLQTDLLYQLNTGLSAGFNTNFVQWNAALAYKFGVKKLTELRFSVNDILSQNTSIQRNVTDTYFEDVESNLLQRYYMLTFTWNFKYFESANKAN